MLIKKHKLHNKIEFNILFNNNRIIKFLRIFIFSLFLFLSGLFFHKAGIGGYILKSLNNSEIIVSHYFQSIFSVPEKLKLNIKFKDYKKLESFRIEAIKEGHLFKNDNSYVKAEIEYGGEIFKSKLRLKGRGLDHLEGDKWSFRVKLKEHKKLFGMEQFSLQHPKTRNYIYEWVFHQALKREGILNLRYKFIDLVLNGKDLGIYALEEHFHSDLLIENRRGPGPILRFDENPYFWENIQNFYQFPESKESGYGVLSSAPIDAFQTSDIMNDSSKKALFLEAFKLLDSFRRGILSTQEVFDTNKLSKYFALTDLLGSEHGARWTNARFYYNPESRLLEPIGYDGNNSTLLNGKTIRYLCATKQGVYINKETDRIKNDYFAILFSDKKFYKKYIKFLVNFSKSSYLDSLFIEIGPDLKNNLKLIYKEFPGFIFNKEKYYKNQNYIREILNPDKALLSYLQKIEKDSLIIKLGNIQALPIEILGLKVDGKMYIDLPNTILLPAKFENENINYTEIIFPSAEYNEPPNFNKQGTIKIIYNIFGTDLEKEEDVYPYPYVTL